MEVKSKVRIYSIKDIMGINVDGFQYLDLHTGSVYIPLDKKTRHKYAIHGSIVKGINNYTIKKNSENIVYVVYIDLPDNTVKKTSVNVSAEGSVINEVIFECHYDFFNSPLEYLSNIIRLVEVSSDSTVKVEFDMEDKHYTILYEKDNISTFEN